MPLHEAFVYDALRTPRTRGKPTGGLHILTPVTLVTAILTELRKRYPGIEGKIDEVVLGCCEQFNDQGGNLARSAVLAAGHPHHVPGLMVSRFCGSALDAVNTGAAKVMAGQSSRGRARGVPPPPPLNDLRLHRASRVGRRVSGLRSPPPRRIIA